jgi:cyclophilin family peptidyl-prolyl cis-trans isomerase
LDPYGALKSRIIYIFWLFHRYGYRTLAVEFELSFGGKDLAWITVELAPIDEMPHTVHMFMEQVDQGLYNDGGYSFHRNSDHIIMGAPISNHLTPDGVDNLEKFNSHGISNVLLQEYSPNFPHQPYTLGLAGRPGGPDFYINIKDNTNVHGPGGYAADGQADPCFARITRGTEIIDRIHGMSGELHEGDWKDIDPFVAVRSAKVIL